MIAIPPALHPELSDADAWTAVVERDARLDGRFVYAVRTTGIYCRPTCPSRRPNRENVSFFESPDLAEQAGFRACLRCRPRRTRPSLAARTIERVREIIDEHPDAPHSLESLARQVGISPFHLHRTFKRLAGVTPKEYVDRRRVERLKTHLRDGDSVSRATYEAGYGSSSRVYEQSAVQLGMTPAAYRRGGRGTSIRYTVVETTLGRLLVGATARGVCAVSLGDADAVLEVALAAEYPEAERLRDDDAFAEWVSAIVAHVEGRERRLDVPLDVAGTDFQLRVWKALREIPFGDTRSYSEIAAAIGAPSAARAVAGACASNRVALVIPCHRVVREGGALGGYRWGVERKRRLLAQERSVAEGEGPVDA